MDRHQVTISKWENGEQEIGALSIVMLCNVLAITPDYLLGFTDNAAARALRNGATFWIDHDAAARIRSARTGSDLHDLLRVHLKVGAEIPANWTEVSEDEFRALQEKAAKLLDLTPGRVAKILRAAK